MFIVIILGVLIALFFKSNSKSCQKRARTVAFSLLAPDKKATRLHGNPKPASRKRSAQQKLERVKARLYEQCQSDEEMVACVDRQRQLYGKGASEYFYWQKALSSNWRPSLVTVSKRPNLSPIPPPPPSQLKSYRSPQQIEAARIEAKRIEVYKATLSESKAESLYKKAKRESPRLTDYQAWEKALDLYLWENRWDRWKEVGYIRR